MTEMNLDELNRLIKEFGDCQKAFMRSENRALLRSVLFDVPRRSSIGWHCYFEKAPDLLRSLCAYATPEEIGRRMRRLCSRPYYLQLSILMCSYLGARQQLLLDGGLEPGQPFTDERLDDMTFLVDFWQRACASYRSDGQVIPEPGNDAQPILPAADVSLLAQGLAPANEADHQRLRRLAATLELYVFILHGEQRDGLFAHGPYEAGDGSQIVLLEFTDLRNDYLPWAATDAVNPYPNLALVRRMRDVDVHFDMFGGIRWDVPDIGPHVEAEGLFTRTGDEIVPVPLEEVAELEAAAAAAQNELFLKAAGWSTRYKAEYGVHLFANHLHPFFELVSDDPSWGERIRGEFEDAAQGLLDDMLAREEPPSIWNYMATTDEDFFWPAAG